MTAAPMLALVLGWSRWLVWLLSLEGARFIRHHDTHVNISAFVVIRGAQFELHIFIDAELNVVQVIFTAEVNVTFVFVFLMVTILFSFVTNKLLKVLVTKLATLWIYDMSFAPIATLVVHRLLLILMEVLRVELKGSHLLPMRQVMTLILEKVIIVLFAGRIV